MNPSEIVKSIITNDFDSICVEYFEEIDSTNTYLSDIKFTHDYHLCFAKTQTAGRGRRESKWVSSNYSNIYASFGFKCDWSVDKIPFISIAVGIAILEAIQLDVPESEQNNIKIKLPNDIYYKNQKLSGVLIETKNIKHNSFDIIIGFGVNVNMTETDDKIDRQWSSVSLIANKNIDLEQLLSNIVINIKNVMKKKLSEIIETFTKYNYVLNKKITFNDGDTIYNGVAKGVDINRQLKLNVGDTCIYVDIAKINKLRII